MRIVFAFRYTMYRKLLKGKRIITKQGKLNALYVSVTKFVSELFPIPAYAIYRVATTKADSFLDRILINLKPTEDWGPANPKDRERNNKLIREKLGTNYLTDWTRHNYK